MTTQPRRPLRLLMLATDAHGGFGGIASGLTPTMA